MPRPLDTLDHLQRRNRSLGFLLAVRQKYSEDRAGYLAASISYYAFFALFPLLLALDSVLGYVLHGRPHFEHEIVTSALGRFPLVGNQLQTHSLRGSGLAIGLGLAASIWAGTGVVLAMQNAVDVFWGIPGLDRPNALRSRLSALATLAMLAVAVIVSAGLSGLGTVGVSLGVGTKAAVIGLSALLDIGLFWTGFRLLSNARVPWRALRGGAIAAGISYECLQLVGGIYVRHVLEKASVTYGEFSLVIGLLSWIYLTVHVTLLAIEGNVVASRHLWPRSLTRSGPLTDADERALRQLTSIAQGRAEQRIEVSFEENEPR